MTINCVHTKDHLLGLLNSAETPVEVFSTVEKVLTVLEHTQGIWAELNYAYKAMEIAARCRLNLNAIESIEDRRTWNNKEATRLRAKTFEIEQVYRTIQNKRFEAAAN